MELPQGLGDRILEGAPGWERAVSTGVSAFDEGQLLAVPAVRRNRQQISIEFSIQLIREDDGRIAWVVAFIREVTQRYRREKELRAQLQRSRP